MGVEIGVEDNYCISRLMRFRERHLTSLTEQPGAHKKINSNALYTSEYIAIYGNVENILQRELLRDI
jgi:hypothetical protein